MEALAAFPDCPACSGSGEILLPASSVPCKNCAGNGKILPPGYKLPSALVAVERGKPGRWMSESTYDGQGRLTWEMRTFVPEEGEEMLNDEC